MRELRWAPYREFASPDPALETSEPPAGPVIIRATGYRRGAGPEEDIIVYWLTPAQDTADRAGAKARWRRHELPGQAVLNPEFLPGGMP